MNVELFKRKLEDLIVECGGLGGDALQFEYSARPLKQRFTPVDPTDVSGDEYLAHRQVQPMKIVFTVHTGRASRWHHDSGDDRKLHPSLKPST